MRTLFYFVINLPKMVQSLSEQTPAISILIIRLIDYQYKGVYPIKYSQWFF